MLILDKRKAVERMLALTAGDPDSAPEFDPHDVSAAITHTRISQGIARYERRTATPAPGRRAVRRRKTPALVDPSPA